MSASVASAELEHPGHLLHSLSGAGSALEQLGAVGLSFSEHRNQAVASVSS